MVPSGEASPRPIRTPVPMPDILLLMEGFQSTAEDDLALRNVRQVENGQEVIWLCREACVGMCMNGASTHKSRGRATICTRVPPAG